MKKITLLSSLLFVMFNLPSYGQCNNSLTGNFDQSDSCTTYSQAQYDNVVITATSPDLIHIDHFGSLTPFHIAYATVDCVNHTVDLPNQLAGVTTLWGSGTFTANFNQITINWTWDYGTGQLNCREVYTRTGSGVEEFSAAGFNLYPSPASATLNLFFFKTENIDVFISNLAGEKILSTHVTENKFQLDVKNLPQGIYFITATGKDKSSVTKRFVKM